MGKDLSAGGSRRLSIDQDKILSDERRVSFSPRSANYFGERAGCEGRLPKNEELRAPMYFC